MYDEDGQVHQEGKLNCGQFIDEIALKIVQYLETRDSSILNKIPVNKIQKYMETRFKITIPDTKSKVELLEQLIELCKSLEQSTIEENYDEFGNEIRTKCLGNDGNIYDIESMFYLFQQNKVGEYLNIPYHYVDEVGRPKFPIMGNGKVLDGYQIVIKENE